MRAETSRSQRVRRVDVVRGVVFDEVCVMGGREVSKEGKEGQPREE
jgi:hypothetical protein